MVEASNSTPRKNSMGAPQGGGLSPIIWRSSTNDIPEAGVKRERHKSQKTENSRTLIIKKNMMVEGVSWKPGSMDLEEQKHRTLRRLL